MKALFDEFPTLLGLSGTHEVLGLSGVTDTDRKAYVTNFYPIAKTAGAKFGLNPIVILAQGGIESGWGTSYMAKNIFNFFGITAAGKPNDFWKGEIYVSKTSGLKFRKYPSVLDCFSDFARLITANYKAAAGVSYSIPDYAREISNSPYAEQDPKNRAIYRKAIISNAAYILNTIGAPQQANVLNTEAAKIVIPSGNEPTSPTVPAPSNNRVSSQTQETQGGGLLLALGAAATAAFFIFDFPKLSHKKK